MFNWIKEKLINAWNWTKRKAKQILIGLGIVGVAVAAGISQIPDQIPSIIAEGQTIEFPYTDENSNENLIIWTDQKEYYPLWAWNEFDVYMAVENKSGKSQEVSFQSFFTKDFTIESIHILNPTATSTIQQPTYSEVCVVGSTSTTCRDEITGSKDVVVLGVWNPIEQKQFSRQNYDRLILEKNIPVKQKSGDKARGHFITYSEKNTFVYYKLRVKANEPFSQEEFDLEAIGSEGAYGLLDPTIFSDDFNSYNDGNLDGQGDWALIYTNHPQVMDGDADNPEGAGVGKQVNASGPNSATDKTGTAQADGRITFYSKHNVTNQRNYFMLFEGGTQAITFTFYDNGNIQIYGDGAWRVIQAYVVDTWYLIEIEWRSSDHKIRARVDDGAWFGWYSGNASWSTGLNKVRIQGGAGNHYFDYIAENPYEEVVRRIMIIE